MRRVALSATISDPEAYQGWLAPHGDIETVDIVMGDPGAEAEICDHAARGREDPLVGP